VIVELKTPNFPLTAEHLGQLETYMMNVKSWLASKSFTNTRVLGYLIGDTDENPQSDGARLLNEKMQQAGPQSPWQVIPLPLLLQRAKKVHLEAIEVAQKYDQYLDGELDSQPHPTVLKPVAKATSNKQTAKKGASAGRKKTAKRRSEKSAAHS